MGLHIVQPREPRKVERQELGPLDTFEYKEEQYVITTQDVSFNLDRCQDSFVNPDELVIPTHLRLNSSYDRTWHKRKEQEARYKEVDAAIYKHVKGDR